MVFLYHCKKSPQTQIKYDATLNPRNLFCFYWLQGALLIL